MPVQKKSKALKEGSHSDAVLSLSWNREYRNVLASGSADATVKVWDVAAQSCQATLQWHSDKVQAVAWNPADAPVLLSGGFDHKIFLVSLPRSTSAGLISWLWCLSILSLQQQQSMAQAGTLIR